MDTPVPIPNTEVKHLNADGTWLETTWESRKLPGYIKLIKSSITLVVVGLFCFRVDKVDVIIYIYDEWDYKIGKVVIIVKKQRRIIGGFILAMMIITSTISYAFEMQSSTSINYFYETEPNDEPESAQLFRRNNDSYKATATGDYSDMHKVLGKLSGENDVDYYKIFLYKNGTKDKYDNILTVSSQNKLVIEVLNEDLVVINTFTQIPGNASNRFQTNIPESQYYYLRLSESGISGENQYSFYFGSPTYSKGSISKNFSTQDMSRYKTREVEWTINTNEVPKDSVAYKITAGAGGDANISHPSIRKYKNTKRSNWTDLKQSKWFADEINPLYLFLGGSYDMNQTWIIFYDASTNTKTPFNVYPSVMIDYIYPNLPR